MTVQIYTLMALEEIQAKTAPFLDYGSATTSSFFGNTTLVMETMRAAQ